MIVVLILSLLATLGLPTFFHMRQTSQNARLANDIRQYAAAIEIFTTDNAAFPESSNSGQVPQDLEPYIHSAHWEKAPSIGGTWSILKDSFNVNSAIGVQGFNVPEDQLLKFERKYDDGNLSSGQFRLLGGNGFYYIIEE